MKRSLKFVARSILPFLLLNAVLTNFRVISAKELGVEERYKIAEKLTNSIKSTPDGNIKVYTEDEYGCPILFYKKGNEEPISIATEVYEGNYAVSSDGRYVAWTGKEFGANPEIYLADMSKGHSIAQKGKDLTQNVSQDGNIINLAPEFLDADNDGKMDIINWLSKEDNRYSSGQAKLSELEKYR